MKQVKVPVEVSGKKLTITIDEEQQAEPQLARLGMKIRKDLHQRLVLHSTMTGKTMAELVEAMIDSTVPDYKIGIETPQEEGKL